MDVLEHLAPSIYYLFLNLKGRKFEHWGGHVGCWFLAQPKEFLLHGLKKLEQRIHKFVELGGNMQSKCILPFL
jgi:hypothetical protein